MNIIIKEKNKKLSQILLSCGLLILGFLFLAWGTYIIENDANNVLDLASIISSSSDTSSKEDKYAYIDLVVVPYKFAVYEDITDSFYLVHDEKYLYIAFMSEEEYQRLEQANKPIRINGITKVTPEDVKEIAIDAYNELYELSEEEKITLADFNNYFGDVYLDMTKSATSSATVQDAIGLLCMIVGIIWFIIALINYNKFNKQGSIIDR